MTENTNLFLFCLSVRTVCMYTTENCQIQGEGQIMRRFTEAIFLPRDYYNFELTLKENDFLISISLEPNVADLR